MGEPRLLHQIGDPDPFEAALTELATRKGTGYYKAPSLKGLWYRPRLLHEGSVSSLEEMFDPNRLNADHVPGGWMPFGQTTYAIRGHRFGLRLTPLERAQLIAFLRTL